MAAHISEQIFFCDEDAQNILQGLSGFVKNPPKQNVFKAKQRFMNQAVLTQRYPETGKERWAKDKGTMLMHHIIQDIIYIQQCIQFYIKYSISHYFTDIYLSKAI